MLGKPLSHLRPLLRLQNHAQPDLFTSNPSLLHHFPQQGGHAVVQAGPSAAQAAGQNTGNAGRAGWGGGAGTGGSGYTGHARAFLGLPQTSSVDPSSGLNDESKDQDRVQISHQRRFQAALFARTQVAAGTLEGREGGRRRIEGREGGLLRAIAMEDASEVRSLDPELTARYLSSAEERAVGERRRGSIAYPQPRPAILAGEPSSSARRELVRSSSSMDVWMGSSTITRPQLRTLSSRSTSIPLPDLDLVDESTPTSIDDITHITPSRSSRIRSIPQPNRVLMDLAGRDLPPSPSIIRRYNSSLATQPTPPLRIFDDLPLPPTYTPPTAELTPEQQADKDMDNKLNKAIVGKTINLHKDGYRSALGALIAHYRSPRQLAPLDERQVPGDPELAVDLPLPSGYSVNTYNACLDALLALREPGESIARVLEGYNEMLERDLVPNMKTYQLVIRALCSRESDIWLVVQRWEREKSWEMWRCEQTGETYTPDEQQILREQLIEGYKAEGNLDSALRLFSAAKTFQNTSKWRFQPRVYHNILKTIGTQIRPNIQGMREVFNHAVSRQPRGVMGLYKYVFEALGRAGHGDELAEQWAKFRKEEEAGSGALLSHWMEVENDTSSDSPEAQNRILGAKLTTYQTAIKYFAQLGRTAEAEEIVKLVESRGKGDIGLVDAYGHLILGLSSRNVGEALEKYSELKPKIQSTKLGRLGVTEAFEIYDNLLRVGEWRTALEIIPPSEDLQVHGGMDFTRVRHTYQSIVTSARNASSPDEAREILSHIPPLLKDRNFSVPTLPAKQHFAVLQQHGLWLDAATALTQFRRHHDRSGAWVEWFTPFVVAAAPHISTRDLLSLYFEGGAIGFDLALDQQLMDVLVDKYVRDRAADPAGWASVMPTYTIRHWGTILSFVQRLRGERYEEGGYDEVLEQIAEDVARELQQGKGGGNKAELRSRLIGKMPRFALTLEDRFGPERAKAMLQGVEMPSGFVWAIDQSAQSSASASASEAEVSTPPPSSEFSIPSPLTSTTSITTPPPVSPQSIGTQYTFSRDLAQSIDSHSARVPRMTTQGAYDLIYSELQRNQVVPSTGTIARLINTLGREGAEDKVNNLYALTQSMLQNQTGYDDRLMASMWCEVESHMIIASCHLGHLERAGAHRQRIIDAGLHPSADAYATMIASSKDTTDDVLVARALFDESQRVGVIPNLYLYNTIISKLSRARKAEMALELFAHMKTAGIEPSSVTYGAVINACCRVGDAQSAETLFKEMRNHRYFKARVPPYNTMMQFFINNSPSRAKVLHYYSLLRQDNVSPSAHTYKLLLDAYATLPPIDLVAMERVYADLLADRSVKPQPTHIASLITAYGIYGDDLAKAMEIFEQPPLEQGRRNGNSNQSGRTHEAIVWEAILNVVAHRGTLADLEAMRQRMDATGIRPTAYVYNVLITGYARAQRIDDARRIFDSMGDSVTGVAAPNNHPVLLTGAGYAKPQTMTEEPTNMVYREPSTYEAMVRAEMSAGDASKAQEVLGRMEARGYPWAVFMRVKAVVEDGSMSGLTGTYGHPSGSSFPAT